MAATPISAIFPRSAPHPSIAVPLGTPWELVPCTATADLTGSAVHNVTADGSTWSRAELGEEKPRPPAR
ncbi:hypothetical protein [Streptomyces sp. NRRL B-24572]|uniref:hypothetical protein n=1 Tax=Streptomyces sp. NRRL B-24572 TaxID=1962156 RepID=UPI00117FCCB1|nr:hypothetical protein [Streptomyces sp. NRRL B-24572]